MKFSNTLLFATFILCADMCLGQLSPGDLATDHADLEGLSNCTQCHDLGNKVLNSKCLACHTEIQDLMDVDKGYHSSSEVEGKDCFECHSEHHGRKFDMVRFDEDNFDHEFTSYTLKGAHKEVDCRECHLSEYIKDEEIRKREKTFLGLVENCLACHDDKHQETLSEDCLSCHDMEAFEPASKFDHEDTNYKLRGKHVEVDCVKCHKKSTTNGVEFQQFADVAHSKCTSCHDDPHQKHLKGKCTQCHVVESFDVFKGDKHFDHNKTHFELRGKHASTKCFECHKSDSGPKEVFQDRLGVKEDECAICHEDEHEGKFGDNCAECHTEESFTALKSMDFFDHLKTDYPLEGKHADVDCKECHDGPYTDPVKFSTCKSCHEDYHEGDFEDYQPSNDCQECHSLHNGFTYSLYTIQQHQDSQFVLDGAHEATPCFACHVDEKEKWKFKDLGQECFDCHDDEHDKKFEEDGVTNCYRCHDSMDWFPRKFDHSETDFPLDGEHANVECLECHKTTIKNGKSSVLYKIEKFECIDCHK